MYGCRHSERIVGEVLAGLRNDVVIATKFGNVFDEQTKRITGFSAEPAFIRNACEASLRRLNTDYIDLYQFHKGEYDLDRADEVVETLERLVEEGKIRAYGWSTDDPERARAFARGEHCAAIQQRLNIFEVARRRSPCVRPNLASINRARWRWVVNGKFTQNRRCPPTTCARRDFPAVRKPSGACWKNCARFLRQVGGRWRRALGWLWRSEVTVPIPASRLWRRWQNAGRWR